MKKIFIVLIVPSLIMGFSACDITNKPEDNNETNEEVVAEVNLVEQAVNYDYDFVLDTNLVIPELKFGANGAELKALPIGRFSDGTTDGFNIAVKYDGIEVGLQLLEVADTVIKAGKLYVLDSLKGFEIYLAGSNPDIYVVPVKAQYTAEKYTLTLGGGDPKAIDVKISKACPAYNSTDNPPALVGVNDARTASVTKANGIIGSLEIPYKVRIHAESLSSGGYDIVFSSNNKKIKYSSGFNFSVLGVPRWGSGFKVIH